MIKKIVLLIISGYRTFFHKYPWILYLQGHCRFVPTCSEYAYQAVEKYGTIRGLIMGAKRIFRCHPWSKAGYDPVV